MGRKAPGDDRFDKSYYDRYYRDPATRVSSAADIKRLGAFVVAYLRHLRLPVRRVLDLGCGLGHWRKVIAEQVPRASYTGVEVSDYLCEQRGWRRGSVVDFQAQVPFDLVICQGVLQYLGDADAAKAIENLARLCRGAMYLEVLTREDWSEHCDRRRTDGGVHLRPAAWYRKRLARHFTQAGGGLFVQRDADAVLYELEKA